MSPLHLWVAGQLQNPVDIRPDMSFDIECYGVEGVLHKDEDEDSRPIFEMRDILSDECAQSLINQVPSGWTSVYLLWNRGLSTSTEHY